MEKKKLFYSNSTVIKNKNNNYLFKGAVLDINKDKLYKINFKNANYNILENNGNSLRINFENANNIFINEEENDVILKTFDKNTGLNYAYQFLFNIPEIKIFFENNKNFTHPLLDYDGILNGKELEDQKNNHFIHAFYSI